MLTSSVARISLQQFADEVLDPKYRQLLKTPQQVIDVLDWKDTQSPVCCDEKVNVLSCIGTPYQARCEKCGKMAVAMDGPSFGNSWVQFLDGEKVDLHTDAVWAIVSPAPDAGRDDHSGEE